MLPLSRVRRLLSYIVSKIMMFCILPPISL
jgi:hypothetical protein